MLKIRLGSIAYASPDDSQKKPRPKWPGNDKTIWGEMVWNLSRCDNYDPVKRVDHRLALVSKESRTKKGQPEDCPEYPALSVGL